MNISRINHVPYSLPTTPKQRGSSYKSVAAKESAGDVSLLVERAAKMPEPVAYNKVEALRVQINAAQYKMDSRQIARAMMNYGKEI